MKFSVDSVEKGSFLVGQNWFLCKKSLCFGIHYVDFSSLSFDMILKILYCADSAYAISLIFDERNKMYIMHIVLSKKKLA